MVPDFPILCPVDVLRVLSLTRVVLRVAVWSNVEVTVEGRLVNVGEEHGHHTEARQCSIILIGGKRLVARLDRRTTTPTVELYRAVRWPIEGFMAEDVAPGLVPMLNVNAFLRSLSPDYNPQRALDIRAP